MLDMVIPYLRHGQANSKMVPEYQAMVSQLLRADGLKCQQQWDLDTPPSVPIYLGLLGLLEFPPISLRSCRIQSCLIITFSCSIICMLCITLLLSILVTARARLHCHTHLSIC